MILVNGLMTNEIYVWIVFFLIMIPSNLIFNYWYWKDENASRTISFSVGLVIGVISMFIALWLVGD